MSPSGFGHRLSGQPGEIITTALLVVVLEVGVRIAIGASMAPEWGTLWIVGLMIAWPPVVAVLGLTAIGWMVGPNPEEEHSTVLARVSGLVVVTTVGHAFALVAGAILFVLVDTPLRYALYWAGYGDLITFDVVVFSPFFGVLIGALIAWTIPGAVAFELGRGRSPLEAVRRGFDLVSYRPRVGLVVAATNGLFGLVFVGGLLGLDILVRRVQFQRLRVTGFADGDLFLFVAGLVALLGLTITWAAVVVRLVNGADGLPVSSRPPIPVVRLALVVLLISALVMTAGAIRANEIRPVDTSPEPLPEDPDGLFGTAYDNTDRASHEYRFINISGETDEVVYEMHIDRQQRQLATNLDGVEQYHTHGEFAYGQPLPGYAMMTEDEAPRIGELSPDATNWTATTERDDEITLELTDSEDVFAAHGETSDALETDFDEPDVHDAWAEVTINTDTHTLAHGEYRLNVTDRAQSGQGIDTWNGLAYETEHETDIEVERPDSHDSSPTVTPVWRVVAY